MTPLLSMQSLELAIGGVDILKGVSLTIGDGEIVGLVGASGSGKSLTALSIVGLLPRHSSLGGSIALRGVELTIQSESRLRQVRGRDVGIVFQEPLTALNPLMRIGDQVAETVRLHTRVPAAEANTRARGALASVGLSDLETMSRFPSELSGGQRQRVAIAIAIVMQPALLLADEPTTALDSVTQAQVLRLLKDLSRNRRMGLLLVSHDLAVVAQMADRIAIMHEGRIVEQGATAATLRHLQHPYAKALLAAAALPPKAASSRTGASAPPLLDARDVVREYPRRRRAAFGATTVFRAVDGASLCVHPGETVGLVGESGSGKSSLLRALLGLDRPQAGEIRLRGESFSAPRVEPSRAQRRSIQAVFQDPYGSFDPEWSVERTVAEPFHLSSPPPPAADRRRRVAAVLEQVGLTPADAHRYPHEFSGGQRQRIAIARALVTEPALIAFDEAVSALDVLVRVQILELLMELSNRLHLAYVFVSHDLNVVRSIADRVYVMQHGRIVEEGPTARLFASPQHAYTQALIAAVPRVSLSG